MGIETKLRVSQSSNCWVTLESVKEPGNFVCIDQTGRSVAAVYSLAPTAQVQANRQITPKLLVCWPHLYQNHNQLNQSDDFLLVEFVYMLSKSRHGLACRCCKWSVIRRYEVRHLVTA